MPTVENLGKNVSEWSELAGEGSSTFDLCIKCYAKLDDNPHIFDTKLKPFGTREPQGFDGWGGDCEHPDYTDNDSRCKVCNKYLSEDD